MDQQFVNAYRFFRANAGGVVGESAKYAIALARAERDGEAAGLTVEWDEDSEPYQLGDYETKPPPYVLCAFVRNPANRRHYLASLGGIGFASDPRRDPYTRVVEAELLDEALDTLQQARAARRATCPACGHMFDHPAT
jgi:hypothetical protein